MTEPLFHYCAACGEVTPEGDMRPTKDGGTEDWCPHCRKEGCMLGFPTEEIALNAGHCPACNNGRLSDPELKCEECGWQYEPDRT